MKGRRDEKIATWMGIIGNSLLFVSKIIIGVLYNSIAIISDALNSFTDIISSLVVHISVQVSHRGADKEHQFGHKRAQPIAGLVVAIFMGILGFQVVSASISRLISGEELFKGYVPIILTVLVMISKFFMYLYANTVSKKQKSPAIRASAIDHRNDILIDFAVLVGVVASNYGYPIFDPIVGITIGFYIIKAGFDIGMENLKFLMGEAPSKELFEKLEKVAKTVPGVLELNDVCAHYVGTTVEAEVHIYVKKTLNVERAHSIAKEVQKKIESVKEISKAFIHVDPFLGTFKKKRKF